MKYIKKPIPVEAFCPAKDEWPKWFSENEYVSIIFTDEGTKIRIFTLEGIMECCENDYIIQGIDGELYPCKRDIFLKTYEIYKEDN